MLDKNHAVKIASKLNAQIKKKNSAHDIAMVFHNGRLIAKFGIRRGSRRSLGHDHIPKELHISSRTCLELAQCTVTLDQWLQVMRGLGLIE